MYGSIDFIFNNIQSTELGLKLVKIQTDGTKENFVSSRSLNVDRLKSSQNNYNTYLYGITAQPMQFTVEFGSEEILTQDKIDEISRVFFLNDFAPFVPMDNNHVYNCIAISGSLNVYGNGHSFSIDFENDSPFSTSDWYQETFDLNSLVTPQTITISNLGNIPMYLYLEIIPKTTGQNIKIINTTNSGMFIRFTTDTNNNQLQANEIISVDFKKNKITTNTLGQYRYANLSSDSEFFECVVGNNVLSVENPCVINAYYRYLYLT